ncbi:D(2) dopamine receptor [Elysia marginata]|uniref:D(2) dopamine receptor n=1 Tax=Elysia marginata TaxID=1093978 RepID=A0AAV4IZK2_9GAST|nr:D(2) dopamine receptor [Elysia marginata]
MMFIAVVFCYINIAVKVRKTKRVGDVTVGQPVTSGARTADDDEPTGNTNDQGFKSVTAKIGSSGAQADSLPTRLSPDTDGRDPGSAGQGGNNSATRNLMSPSTIIQYLAPPERDRTRKIVTTMSTSYDPSNPCNPQKPTVGIGTATQVFVVSSGESVTDGQGTVKQQSSAELAEVPLQVLPRGGNGGGSQSNALINTDAGLTTTETRQDVPSARTRLSKMSKHKAQIRQQRNVRITGLLFVVTSVFILSWVPPYIAMVKGFYIGYTFPFTMGEWLLLSYGRSCYVLNTFSNPIIYAALSATYRRHIMELGKVLWKSLAKIRCRWS